MTATLVGMPKKKPAPASASESPATDVVRIEADLAEMVRLMATKRRVQVSDILSPLLRPVLVPMFQEFLAELNRRKGLHG